MSIPFDSQISASADVMVRQIGEESVLLDLKTEQYFGLDDVSSRMWKLLTANDSIQSAYEALIAEYHVDPEQLRKDMEDFVQELLQMGLIQQNRP